MMGQKSPDHGTKPWICIGCGRIRSIHGEATPRFRCVCGDTAYERVSSPQAVAAAQIRNPGNRVIWYLRGGRIEPAAGKRQWRPVFKND
jgi:hypothetical protein